MQNTHLPFPGATGTWPEPSDQGEFGISVFPAHCPLTFIQSPWGPEGFFWTPSVGSGMLLLLFIAGNF